MLRLKLRDESCSFGSVKADENGTLLADLKSTRAAVKQSAALTLGYIQYQQCPSAVLKACKALLSLLDPLAKVNKSASLSWVC